MALSCGSAPAQGTSVVESACEARVCERAPEPTIHPVSKCPTSPLPTSRSEWGPGCRVLDLQSVCGDIVRYYSAFGPTDLVSGFYVHSLCTTAIGELRHDANFGHVRQTLGPR